MEEVTWRSYDAPRALACRSAAPVRSGCLTLGRRCLQLAGRRLRPCRCACGRSRTAGLVSCVDCLQSLLCSTGASDSPATSRARMCCSTAPAVGVLATWVLRGGSRRGLEAALWLLHTCKRIGYAGDIIADITRLHWAGISLIDVSKFDVPDS